LGGSGSDPAAAIAVDGAGNAYVTGTTSSPNFPTTAGAFQPTLTGIRDAFVAKIPTATIEGLIAEVGTLDLNGGEQNSLTGKLEAAERSLARGNATPAINQLDAFINEVRALERSGRLDTATADGLIAQTQAIIGHL
jgi:Ca2+-binding RTX toxin-like protein